MTEGDSGTQNATFTVTLAPTSGQNVSVDYATADGTATAPADYAATSGTLTFAPGQATKTVTVQVVGDTLDELDETFTVNLSNAVNAAILDPTGLGTIVDNDPPPALSINDVTVTEPDTGTVERDVHGQPDRARAHADHRRLRDRERHRDRAGRLHGGLSGTLTFTPGQTTKTVTVPVNGDLLDEAERDLLRQPHEPGERDDRRRPGPGHDHRRRPAAVAHDQRRHRHRGQRRDDVRRDLHGHSERRRAARRSRSTSRPRTAPRPRPADYTATNGTLTFTPGQTTKTVTVTVNGDLLDEANETLFVNLTNPVNATIADAQGVGHDHRRRRAAGALDRRRDRHRGQLGNGQRDLHGHARAGQRPAR